MEINHQLSSCLSTYGISELFYMHTGHLLNWLHVDDAGIMHTGHLLTWLHVDDAGITRLDFLGVVLELLAGSAIDLLQQFDELARDMSGVAVHHGSVTLADLTRVVQDDDLQDTDISNAV